MSLADKWPDRWYDCSPVIDEGPAIEDVYVGADGEYHAYAETNQRRGTPPAVSSWSGRVF